MTVSDITNQAMFQLGNDAEDLVDYVPYIDVYVGEAYDLLAYAYARKHPSADDAEYPTPLSDEVLANKLPEWTHPAIAHYVTWCLYRNGNSNKQQRGYQFYQAFDAILKRVLDQGGNTSVDVRRFRNIPR